ncbi:DgyrCDS1064 [Dimorphilus gyrociliatus]|uniref:pyridoxal 5'-phosphate synthase n=1 Tax=Dimorphilus gyrociliatus TaxID=2664684 RepID=A0A7I8V907_9ANNE|nr:DgyrCDS1064 [Dimorphilus gyrociliatus]
MILRAKNCIKDPFMNMSDTCNRTLSDLIEKNDGLQQQKFDMVRFSKSSVERHPMDQFNKMQTEYEKFIKVNQFILCTSGNDNKPSARTMVLTKTSKEQTSFHFFAMTTSRKAEELEENNYATAIFLWTINGVLNQIRVEGRVNKLSESETLKDYSKLSDDYKAYYHITQQGQAVQSVSDLQEKHEKFLGIVHELPCPFHVRSYALEADSVEIFKPDGLFGNERVLYRKQIEGEDINELITSNGEGDWLIENICP